MKAERVVLDVRHILAQLDIRFEQYEEWKQLTEQTEHTERLDRRMEETNWFHEQSAAGYSYEMEARNAI
ncbi:hypothetical protein [Paenibacillus contaminans]|uniref:Uncharacterized protein n=1 Tax=Paenibacillus contaminans TaxID=450362 RepID=A0A329MRG6_9BACL|nr:hypothetical protein [Paenibacillus contaminans]RAV22130.1 hypothetical protein DQG23_08845 [Paenibacillus contaminans]